MHYITCRGRVPSGCGCRGIPIRRRVRCIGWYFGVWCSTSRAFAWAGFDYKRLTGLSMAHQKCLSFVESVREYLLNAEVQLTQLQSQLRIPYGLSLKV